MSKAALVSCHVPVRSWHSTVTNCHPTKEKHRDWKEPFASGCVASLFLTKSHGVGEYHRVMSSPTNFCWVFWLLHWFLERSIFIQIYQKKHFKSKPQIFSFSCSSERHSLTTYSSSQSLIRLNHINSKKKNYKRLKSTKLSFLSTCLQFESAVLTMNTGYCRHRYIYKQKNAISLAKLGYIWKDLHTVA